MPSSRVELTVYTGTPLYSMLWASFDDKECPRGRPIDAGLFGEAGPWQVVGWRKEAGPLTTSPEQTTFYMQKYESWGKE